MFTVKGTKRTIRVRDLYVNVRERVSYLVVLSCLMLILSPSAMASEYATIHGATYEWESLEPLGNVIIEVNSTPPQ